MHCRRFWNKSTSSILAVVALVLLTNQGIAQQVPVGNPQQPTTGTQPPNTVGSQGQSGVAIDAEGVLVQRVFPDPTGQLTRQRLAEARVALDRDLAKPSKLRKVSLNRLEAAVAAQLAEGRRPTNPMRYLAGLTRIRYVFYYPETHDIVIAGPAEGWGADLSGRVVGIDSGRPVLELEDLVVALRAFAPNRKPAGAVVCSIDPTPEGLSRMQQFLRSVGGNATPGDTQFIVNGLRESLGLQTVMVGGVSPKTHFARVMVEADYRMKLIGIGLENPPVKLTSYVAKATPSSVSKNALQRWYFVPNYECVRVADDQHAMELVGDGVKLVGEHELVAGDGSRKVSGQVDRASQQFTDGFTKAYPELAKKSPVYAQLRNLVDMLVATAFMQKHDYYGKAGWSLEVFGDEKQFPVEIHDAPKQAATAVNSLWKGNRLMTPVGGGVQIEAWKALESSAVLADDGGKVDAERARIQANDFPKDHWWWD